MNRKNLSLLIICFYFAFAVIQASAQTTAFVNVNVIPMDKQRVLQNQTVIIRDNLITEIGSSKKIKVPKDAVRIDAQGKYLIPGLVDTHVHIETDLDLPLYLANGITTVLNLRGRSFHLDLRSRLATGKIIGPRLFTSGPLIIGSTSAVRLIQETKSAGYDFVKIYGNWTEDAYLAAVAEAQKLGIKAVGHAPRNLPFEVVLKGGVEHMAHLEEAVYTYAPLNAWFEDYRLINGGKLTGTKKDNPVLTLEQPVRQLAKSIKRADLWVIPTMIVIDNYVRQGSETSFSELINRSYMQYLDPISRRNWQASFQPKYLVQFQQLLRLEKFMVKIFHQEGVKLALGTDARNRPTMPGYSLHQELELMVESGLTPYEALQMATKNAADFLEISKESGTIEQGKRADLVLVSKNPLEDIHNAAQIDGLVLNGKWLPKENLEAQLKSLKDSFTDLNAQVEIIDKAFTLGGAKSAVVAFQKIQPSQPDVAKYVESMLNGEGYRLLGQSQTDKAIEVFLINVEIFPKSANAYDSLAEAYMLAGNKKLAIENYRKSLELNPQNGNAIEMLKKLG